MRPIDWEIFFSNLRSRSRVQFEGVFFLDGGAVGRIRNDGRVLAQVFQWVSPAFDGEVVLPGPAAWRRKNSSCFFAHVFAGSGMAISSGFGPSLPALVFQADASFGSVAEDFAAFIGSMSAFAEGFLREELAGAAPSAGEETLVAGLARAFDAALSAPAAVAVLGASVLAGVLVMGRSPRRVARRAGIPAASSSEQLF